MAGIRSLSDEDLTKVDRPPPYSSGSSGHARPGSSVRPAAEKPASTGFSVRPASAPLRKSDRSQVTDAGKIKKRIDHSAWRSHGQDPVYLPSIELVEFRPRTGADSLSLAESGDLPTSRQSPRTGSPDQNIPPSRQSPRTGSPDKNIPPSRQSPRTGSPDRNTSSSRQSPGSPDKNIPPSWESPTTASLENVPQRGRCARFGYILKANLRELTLGRHAKWFIPVCAVVLLILLLIIFLPISFTYVEYFQIALLRTRSTGVVDKSQTYYPGCYVLGPDSEFVVFPYNGHYVKEQKLEVYNQDQLGVAFSLSYKYYLQSENIGDLFELFGHHYDDVLRRISRAAMKNAVVQYSLDEMRLNRSLIEQAMSKAVREQLSNYHVDVKYFWLGEMDIPDAVASRFLTQALALVSAETELLIQNHAVMEKETERVTAVHTNTAMEFLAASRASQHRILANATAKYDHVTQSATFEGWDKMCQRLGFTEEDHKLSILMIRSLARMDNLYMATSDQDNITYSYLTGDFSFL